MFGVVRRFGASQALRVVAPRSTPARWTPQLLKWQPSTIRSPAIGRSFQTFPALREAAAAAKAETDDVSQQDLITEFTDLQKSGLIDQKIIQNITHPNRMGLKTMTDVQSQTINQMLQGDDILGQAKTGTGKTLAFLVPTMQNILSDPTFTRARVGRYRNGNQAGADDIRALVISPTRELAEQIAAEAMKVSANTGLIVQTAVGGTQKRFGLQKIQRDGCHLLVGTPGRLKDIFSDRRNGVSAPKLNTLILDEADRLLDQGFAAEIQEIMALLPDPYKVDRQTLMLSATVPREVMAMVKRTMKPDFKFIKTIREDEAPTHLRVPQKAVFMSGLENAIPTVLDIAKEYQARQVQDENLRPFKAIVYFNSTAAVSLAANVFSDLQTSFEDRRSPLGRMQMIEIHSRLTQAQRTYSANGFRKAREAILFSSDVTARGMDFPDVTHVIQVGIPRDAETYIHRLGRTARANKTGEGWLLVHDGESDYYRKMLGQIPIQTDSTSFPVAREDVSAGLTPGSSIAQVKGAMAEISPVTREAAWRAMLGDAVRNFSNRREAVFSLNQMATQGFALEEPPTISPLTAKNLGLDRVRNINVAGGGRRFDGPGRDHDRNFGRSPARGRGGFDRRGGGHGGFNDRRPSSRKNWGDVEGGFNDDIESTFDRPFKRGNRRSSYGRRDDYF
ncbi:ATP-dependent RNA helicase [Penicillium argentinense]|uniref:ATP-dependent RNA helicase n=1 Tax=Penicillium argentinense TaxID=1131581 RepID=A0A9W9EWP1_9EURO|nr:ATP-dependent RNA helicase [Penicillium argentinense]KAJ5089245.1 ATP-dependent RNA helicase [Penicillium argentinense]